MGEKLHDTEMGNDLSPMTPKEQVTKAKIDKWYYIKCKNICARNNQQNEKMTYQTGESICKPDTRLRGNIQNIFENSYNSLTTTTKN